MGSYDLAVIGLGAWGSGAALSGARRFGKGVIGFEQFELGHARGASEDRSRIIRYSYHHRDYVALAAHAYADWARVEQEAGAKLVYKTGGLDFFPPDGPESLSAYQAAMEAGAVDYEVMKPAQVLDRFPAFFLEEEVITLFQPDGGLVAADLATRAMRALAVDGGAELRSGTPVSAVRRLEGGFEVRTGNDTVRTQRLVVTADAWTNQLLSSLGRHLNLEVTQEQVSYYRADPAFSAAGFPVWIWMGDPGFYGLPSLQDSGLKIGQDVGGRRVEADQRSFDPDPAYSRRLHDFMKGLIPSGWDEALIEKTCLYTLTPDREFVLDQIPGIPGSAIGLGAAHGFKFAPTAGRILVDLACGEDPGIERDRFRADRPVLTMDNPPTNYLV
jgi:sarcosine oxidase